MTTDEAREAIDALGCEAYVGVGDKSLRDQSFIVDGWVTSDLLRKIADIMDKVGA